MEIRGKEFNNWHLFEFDGVVDLHSIHDLKNLFKQLKDQGKDKNVLLDFTNVKSIDSSGISCLLYGQKLLLEIDLKLRIVNLSAPVKIVFQITRGYEFFEIYDEFDYATSIEHSINMDDEKVA